MSLFTSVDLKCASIHWTDRFTASIHVGTICIGVLILMILPLAQAQEPVETAKSAATLDAIIVTANKRVENVQEVPKQVMVVTPQALSRAGVTTIGELANAIPSIAGVSEERAAPAIRGISSFSISISAQSQTGVVIDDVPQASFSSLFKELTDIERVEVMAGPQSTLSGRNASGGLINIVTREPADVFAADVSADITSDNQQRFTAFMTGPLSDTLAFSLSAFSNEWDGHIRSMSETLNLKKSLRLGGWDTQGARGKLRWQPNERLNSTLTLYTMERILPQTARTPQGTYFHVDPQARYRYDTLDRNVKQMFPGLVIAPWNVWTGSPGHGIFTTRDKGGSLKVEYELDNASILTSISSFAKADMPRQELTLGVPTEGMVNCADPSCPVIMDQRYPYTINGYSTETRIQEFRLNSPGDQRFEYLVGLIYSDTDTDRPYRRLDTSRVNWLRSSEIQSGAVFARGTWSVGARDALIAGVRYQRDEMGYTFGMLPLLEDATVFDYYVEGTSKYNFFSGEVSWRHALADHVNAYLTLSSTESGEVYDLEDNRGALAPGGLQPQDSQKVRNIEVGMKSQWWDRRLTFNINVFLAKYDNYHIQSQEDAPDPRDPPILKLLPIGKVETQGVEFETRLRATERLSLNLGGAWIDASITDYPDGPCWQRQTENQGCRLPRVPGGPRYQESLAGNRMPSAPRWNMTSSANYFVPLDARAFDLEFGAFWRWQSETWFDFRGNPDLYQGSYGILNLSATALDRNGRYSLTVYVNNVLDKHYYLSMGDDTNWSGPAYFGGFARDGFRYSGVRFQVNF